MCLWILPLLTHRQLPLRPGMQFPRNCNMVCLPSPQPLESSYVRGKRLYSVSPHPEDVPNLLSTRGNCSRLYWDVLWGCLCGVGFYVFSSPLNSSPAPPWEVPSARRGSACTCRPPCPSTCGRSWWASAWRSPGWYRALWTCCQWGGGSKVKRREVWDGQEMGAPPTGPSESCELNHMTSVGGASAARHTWSACGSNKSNMAGE